MTSSAPRMPGNDKYSKAYLVALLVAEYLWESYSFEEDISINPYRKREEGERDVPDYNTRNEILKSMTLVHSSWTGLAQQALSRRVSIHDIDVRRCEIMKKFGPWIKTMEFKAIHDRCSDGARCVCYDSLRKLALKLPMLECLSVDLTGIGKSDALSVMIAACRFNKLRALHLTSTKGERRGWGTWVVEGISNLFAAIASLESLEVLSIVTCFRSTKKGSDKSIPENLMKLCPPASLKTIYFDNNEIRISYIKWFLEARGHFKPTSLHLFMGKSVKHKKIVKALTNTFPHLMKLSLHADYEHIASAFFDEEYNGVVQEILSKTVNLKTLEIRYPYGLLMTKMKLPSSLQILRINNFESDAFYMLGAWCCLLDDGDSKVEHRELQIPEEDLEYMTRLWRSSTTEKTRDKIRLQTIKAVNEL